MMTNGRTTVETKIEADVRDSRSRRDPHDRDHPLRRRPGRATISANGTEVELTPGGLVHIHTRAPHAVVATEPSYLLLTLLDPPRNRG